MFHKSNRDSSQELQTAIKNTITPYLDADMALLQEARSQLLIALSRYKAVLFENGEGSKYCYPSCSSERLTQLSDAVGNGNRDEKQDPLSLLHLLEDSKECNIKNLIDIMVRLGNILQPMDGYPPLKQASQKNIKNAMVILFELIKQLKLLPQLSNHPDLLKEIYHNQKYRDLFKCIDGLLDEVDAIYKEVSSFSVILEKVYNSSCSIYNSMANKMTFFSSHNPVIPEKKPEVEETLAIQMSPLF